MFPHLCSHAYVPTHMFPHICSHTHHCRRAALADVGSGAASASDKGRDAASCAGGLAKRVRAWLRGDAYTQYHALSLTFAHRTHHTTDLLTILTHAPQVGDGLRGMHTLTITNCYSPYYWPGVPSPRPHASQVGAWLRGVRGGGGGHVSSTQSPLPAESDQHPILDQEPSSKDPTADSCLSRTCESAFGGIRLLASTPLLRALTLHTLLITVLVSGVWYERAAAVAAAFTIDETLPTQDDVDSAR